MTPITDKMLEALEADASWLAGEMKLNGAAQRIRAAVAALRTLPVTADGIRVVPGTTLYRAMFYGKEHGLVVTAVHDTVPRLIAQSYSTFTAAEAAREKR